jgi:hypothetical protein
MLWRVVISARRTDMRGVRRIAGRRMRRNRDTVCRHAIGDAWAKVSWRFVAGVVDLHVSGVVDASCIMAGI